MAITSPSQYSMPRVESGRAGDAELPRAYIYFYIMPIFSLHPAQWNHPVLRAQRKFINNVDDSCQVKFA
jgi:hypothetical protein